MKTSELELKLKNIGYLAVVATELDDDTGWLTIRDKGFNRVAKVSLRESNKINSDFNLPISDEAFDLIVRFAQTPIGKRNDEELYVIILPIVGRDWEYSYIDKDGDFSVTDNLDSIDMLTETEIKDIDLRWMVFAKRRLDNGNTYLY